MLGCLAYRLQSNEKPLFWETYVNSIIKPNFPVSSLGMTNCVPLHSLTPFYQYLLRETVVFNPCRQLSQTKWTYCIPHCKKWRNPKPNPYSKFKFLPYLKVSKRCRDTYLFGGVVIPAEHFFAEVEALSETVIPGINLSLDTLMLVHHQFDSWHIAETKHKKKTYNNDISLGL